MFILFCLSIIIEWLEPFQDWIPQTMDHIYTQDQYGSKRFRIPAIAYLKDGNLLLLNDIRYNGEDMLPSKIGIVAKKGKGTDQIWSDAYLISGEVRDVGDGDPAVVVDRKTGAIMVLWAGDKKFTSNANDANASTAADPMRIYMSRSYDNGITWESKIDITNQLYSQLCTTCSNTHKNIPAMFVSSGNGCIMRNGTVVFATVAARASNSNVNYLIYSHDFGDTWNISPSWPVSVVNEAKVIERNSGQLYMTLTFYSDSKVAKKYAWTEDFGATWGAREDGAIWDAAVNGDTIVYTSVVDGFNKNRVLSTLLFTQSGRTNLTLMLSYDEGESWTYQKSIEYLDSAYSSIAADKDGNIFVYFEKLGQNNKKYDLHVSRVTLDWLTDGRDHYQKPTTIQWCLSSDENKKKCPNGYYNFDAVVFDRYVESYMVYPVNVNYNFVEPFRNFNINLSCEGLITGNYINQNSSFDVTFVGTNTTQRNFTFKNINVFVPSNEMKYLNILVENGQLNLIDANDLKVFVGTNKIILEDKDSYQRELTVPSSSKVLIKNSGKVTVYKLNSNTSEDGLVDLTIEGSGQKSYATLKDDLSKNIKFKNCAVYEEKLGRPSLLSSTLTKNDHKLEKTISLDSFLPMLVTSVVLGIVLSMGAAHITKFI